MQRDCCLTIQFCRNKRNPSLLGVLMRLHFKNFILSGLYALVEEMLKVIQPLFLAGLIQRFAYGSTVTATQAYLYALGMNMSWHDYELTLTATMRGS